MNFKKYVGEKMRRRREEMGYSSQSAFAKVIHVDKSRVNRWETGTNLPDPDFRAKIIDKLKLPDDFFEVTAPLPEPPIPAFDDAATFLAKFSNLSPPRRALVLAIVNDDAHHVDPDSPLLPILEELLKSQP